MEALAALSRSSACAWRTLTTFPSSLFQRTPVVAGASACRGTSPAAAASDRPRSTFFRQPAKVAGAPWSRVPSTVATAGTSEDCSSRFPRRPLAHAAHTLPPWLGTMCLSGIA
jgi:hypothetical protein